MRFLASINYFKSFHNRTNISKNLSIYEKKYSKVSFLVNNSNNENTMAHISSTKENIGRKYIVINTSIYITHTYNK